MADGIVLGILAVVDLAFFVFLRVQRSKRKSRERMIEILNGYVRRENGYQVPKRRRLLLLKTT